MTTQNKPTTNEYSGPERRKVEDLQTQMKEIAKEIHQLYLQKMNKVPPLSLVSLAIGSISVASILVIGGINIMINNATTAVELKSIHHLLQSANSDRFRGQDAIREFSLRDQRMDYFQTQLLQVRKNHIAHEKESWHPKTGVEIQRLRDHISRGGIEEE